MDIHVLSTDPKMRSVVCAFHIPMPGGNNAAGVPWSTAIISQGVQPSTVPNITTEEAAQIAAGQVIEIIENVGFSSTGLTNIQRLNEIKAEFTAKRAALLADRQATLNFTGYKTNVA